MLHIWNAIPKDLKIVRLLPTFFSTYTVAVPTRDNKPATVAKALVGNWFLYLAVPQRLRSDQDCNFGSELWPNYPALKVQRRVGQPHITKQGWPIDFMLNISADVNSVWKGSVWDNRRVLQYAYEKDMSQRRVNCTDKHMLGRRGLAVILNICHQRYVIMLGIECIM